MREYMYQGNSTMSIVPDSYMEQTLNQPINVYMYNRKQVKS